MNAAVPESPEVIEGTWEEISRQASKLNGHRLRVMILPDEEAMPSGRYAARMRVALSAAEAASATAEEQAEAEREMNEILNGLNENRRRDGAEPLF